MWHPFAMNLKSKAAEQKQACRQEARRREAKPTGLQERPERTKKVRRFYSDGSDRLARRQQGERASSDLKGTPWRFLVLIMLTLCSFLNDLAVVFVHQRFIFIVLLQAG